MRIIDWNALTAADQTAALCRPAQRNAEEVSRLVQHTIDEVRRDGDDALARLTLKYDDVSIDEFEVSLAEYALAERALNAEQHAAIERAIGTVHQFHAAQMPDMIRVETAPGVICERISVPLNAVGLYVPAGTAPLPSTAIMLSVPAAIARCPTRILCTPPGLDGSANSAVLVAARKAGIERIFKLGGAQAVAAMAYGTQSVPKCDKIFGPGNAWVTAAKLAVAQDPAGAAADLPAGVTEVLIIADDSAEARFVAADLLAQAEHSTDAQAILVTTSRLLAEQVAEQLIQQLPTLSRAAILNESTKSVRLIIVDSLQKAFAVANDYAPEHLLMQISDARAHLASITTAGAVFLGNWSPESMGDYCSGPNHTLPTYGYARAYSGLSLEDFQRRMTVQELSKEGLKGLARTAAVLAALEGLDAHAAAVTIRLQALS
jgi:histidinol dehydrogenase